MSSILTSSIGKKFWMALVGLFLCLFLLLHLTINLLVLLPDRSHFDLGVKIMSTAPVKALEIFLFGSFALHIILGIYLQIRNWMARPVRYAKKHYSETSFFSKYMIWTGGIVIIFLALHMTDFLFYKYGWFGFTPESIGIGANPATDTEASHNFYDIARYVFSNSAYCLLYIFFMVILAFHLIHAFQSGFQSIGWNHPTYTPIIKWIGYIYAVAVPVGFAVIPLYFMLGGK
jgi:succinate dehydrogenase / fumarate reductase cytochrome b subunit